MSSEEEGDRKGEKKEDLVEAENDEDERKIDLATGQEGGDDGDEQNIENSEDGQERDVNSGQSVKDEEAEEKPDREGKEETEDEEVRPSIYIASRGFSGPPSFSQFAKGVKPNNQSDGSSADADGSKDKSTKKK
ncbi:hypothetical protein KP509_14G048500 [Ceratopteris richardii]|uniref:Uncharacterized protein n=1 Tax=Ceratopteris richardii TaxID=49495 RepID=A0A8T2T9Y5_CERRI|nr:hypothetical protein KP509_14G048500 [Ceratopteris richardii]KAH7415498.1 hypothetical protein KP509_14G048500 [Ceratopteris richardii]